MEMPSAILMLGLMMISAATTDENSDGARAHVANRTQNFAKKKRIEI
jgi:hypothetical protein